MNKWQFTIEDLDMSLLEELEPEDVRSYLISKYDIDTANKIISLIEQKWKTFQKLNTQHIT